MMKKMVIIAFALILCLSLSVPAFAETDMPRLLDVADVLSADEESTISTKLDSVSETHKVDLVIVTLETIDGAVIGEFTEGFYASSGYGYGAKRDGVMLLVAMKEGKFHIYGHGLGNQSVSDDEKDSIIESISPMLSDDDFVSAFNEYIDECDYQINGQINGFPFDIGNNLLIALGVGLVLALIVTGVWKSQLKSVRQQENATAYTKAGSLQVAYANEFYLYSTVTRTKKAQSSSGSSGGSGGSGRSGSF